MSSAPISDHPAAQLITPAQRLNAAIEIAVDIAARRRAIADEDKALAKQEQDLLRRAIPELLATLGTSVWENDAGKVTVRPKVQGAFSRAPDQDKALQILRGLGFGGALKTVLTVEFNEAEHNMAGEIAGEIKSHHGKDAVFDRAVNPSTLAAFARDKISEGVDVDLEALGLAMWREAVVTPKSK